MDANGAMEDRRRPQVSQTFGEDLNIAWTRNPTYLHVIMSLSVFIYINIYVLKRTNEKW